MLDNSNTAESRSRCAACGTELSFNPEIELCSGHPGVGGEDNRIWCDFFHRGKEIERVDNFRDDTSTDVVTASNLEAMGY